MSLAVFPGERTWAVNGSKYGGSIVVGLDSSIPGFCVSNNPTQSVLGIYRSMYETLVERDSSGGFTGLLAESVTSNPLKDVWTIVLKTGISYHDGSPLNAENVALNLNAVRGSLFAGASTSHLLGTGVSRFANIISVVVSSDQVVTVTLDRPQNDFIETLYDRGNGFMRSSAQINNRTSCATSPVGTGPFRFLSGAVPGPQFVVVKNESYWRRDQISGERLPYLDQITFSQVTEGSQRSAALRSGNLDVAVFNQKETVFTRDLRVRRDSLDEYQAKNSKIETIWINAGKISSPLSNRNARLALSYATDQEAFRLIRRDGEGSATKSLFPSNSVLFTSAGIHSYDLNRAKEYVAAYKSETGQASLSFSLAVSPGTFDHADGNFLRTMWAEAGIDVSLVIEERAVIVSKMFNASRTGSEQNAYDAVIYDLFYGDDNSVNVPHLVDNVFVSGSQNSLSTTFRISLGPLLGISHHGDASVDNKIFSAQGQTNPKLRSNKYREAVAYFQDNAFAVPLAQGSLSYFTSRRIAGIGSTYLSQDKRALGVNSWGFDWGAVYTSDADHPIPPSSENSSFNELAWTGGNPRSVLVDASGEFSFVVKSNEGSICKILLSSGVETSCVDVGGNPQSLVKVSSQAFGYFVDGASKKLRKINLATGLVTDVVTLTTEPTAVAVTSDGALAFVASPGQSVIYKVDLGSQQVVSQLTVTGAPAGLALSKDDSALWVSLSAKNALVRISVISDAITNTVAVGDLPWGVTMSPSGRFVFVVNQNSGSVTRVDTATKSVTNVLDGGVQPVAMSLSVDGRRAFVANGFTNSVGVMQIPEEPALVAPVQPSAPFSPPSAPAPIPAGNSLTTVPSKAPSISLSGISVAVAKAPAQTVATSCAIAVATTKVNVGLVVPTATSKTNQVVKYVIQLKPKSAGSTVTKTISVAAGRTVAMSLTGKPGTTYKVVVTAMTKSGKKLTWNGPSVALPKKKK